MWTQRHQGLVCTEDRPPADSEAATCNPQGGREGTTPEDTLLSAPAPRTAGRQMAAIEASLGQAELATGSGQGSVRGQYLHCLPRERFPAQRVACAKAWRQKRARCAREPREDGEARGEQQWGDTRGHLHRAWHGARISFLGPCKATRVLVRGET